MDFIFKSYKATACYPFWVIPNGSALGDEVNEVGRYWVRISVGMPQSPQINFLLITSRTRGT
jgi:hypothetical protein